MIAWLGFAAGVLLLATTAASVIKTFLIPRGSRTRVNNVIAVITYGAFRSFTTRIDDLSRRERILSAAGPSFLIGLLSCWLVFLYAGFTLLLWPFNHSFAAALRESGSSLFTLGFAVPKGSAASAIVFIAAASGLAVLALLISYLPVLYAAFNRRETLVGMFEALRRRTAVGT